MSSAIRMIDVIDRKRRGEALTEAEIAAVVADFTAGRTPDYQMAALLMAILLRGMTADETTRADAGDGPLRRAARPERHRRRSSPTSTAPAASATRRRSSSRRSSPPCGVHVGKMSGRGLAYTGGTIDKLECIAGFAATLPADRFRAAARRHRLSWPANRPSSPRPTG